MNPTLPTPDQLDPKVVKVVKVIKQLEGGDYENRTGDQGSSAGAFQWNNNKKALAPNEVPARWREHAQEILGDGNAPMTKENQNKVMYGKVKKWKDEGRQPEEIDALWNGAKKNADGTYRHVSEDRANKFRQALTGGSQQLVYNPKPFSKPEEGQEVIKPEAPKPVPVKQESLYNKVVSPVENFGAGVGSSIGNMLTGLFGGAAKLVGADKTAKKIEGFRQKAFANPALPQNQSLDTKSATAGKITGDVVPYLIPTGAGLLAQAGKDAVVGFGQSQGDLKKAAIAGGTSAGIGLIGKAFSGATRSIVDDVAPEISKKTFAGATKKGLLGKITPVVEKRTQEVAKVVDEAIPEFKKLKTYTDKANATKQALIKEAEALKSAVETGGSNRIYKFQDLAKRMRDVDRDIEIAADPILDRKFKLAQEAALKIAKQKGGKISNLMEARKDFDALVEKQFPTLYDRTNAPMRNAITKIRNTMNDFIEEGLPDGLGYKESLAKQTRLYDAIDNLQGKAFGEIGTTGLSRLAQNNPIKVGLLKKLGGAALTGLGAAGALKGYDSLTDKR